MVRTIKSHDEEEEADDEEFLSRITNDGSSEKVILDGKSADQKGNSLRSKHSETEQRRRSKINERFETLRNLIPQNDQKRDRASFLLEVIQYIQFLQERLRMYEGTYPGWSAEPSKLTPWRNNCGPVGSFVDQSQLAKNGSGHQDDIVVAPVLLSNPQNLVEPDLSGTAAYKMTDNSPGAATQSIPLSVPLRPDLFNDMPAQPPLDAICDAEQLPPHSRSQFWLCRPCTTECAIPSYTLDQPGELEIDSGDANISNAYSQGLLSSLSHALQSSGVDLSQASISVQLDIGKQTNSGLAAKTFSAKDHENSSPGNLAVHHYGVGSSSKEPDEAHKRFRTEEG